MYSGFADAAATVIEGQRREEESSVIVQSSHSLFRVSRTIFLRFEGVSGPQQSDRDKISTSAKRLVRHVLSQDFKSDGPSPVCCPRYVLYNMYC